MWSLSHWGFLRWVCSQAYTHFNMLCANACPSRGFIFLKCKQILVVSIFPQTHVHYTKYPRVNLGDMYALVFSLSLWLAIYILSHHYHCIYHGEMWQIRGRYWFRGSHGQCHFFIRHEPNIFISEAPFRYNSYLVIYWRKYSFRNKFWKLQVILKHNIYSC